MEQKRKTRTWCGFLLLLVLLAVFLIWNLFAGSVQLSASQIGQILLGGGDDLTQQRIIMQIRLPRMASALILGGALSVSGYLLQTFFHNPIAGPFVLGISSGAKLASSSSTNMESCPSMWLPVWAAAAMPWASSLPFSRMRPCIWSA